MRLRHSLAAGLPAVFLLFALNFTLFLWGESEEGASFRDLDSALQRQLLIASIRQRLQDVHREMTLRSEVPGGGAGARSPEDSAWLRNQLDTVRRDVAEARSLSSPEAVGDLHQVTRTFEDLARSWTIAHERLGVDDAGAITELSLHAEPLAATVLGPLMREWETRERARAVAARASLRGVRRLVFQVTVATFTLSCVVALGILAALARSLAAAGDGDSGAWLRRRPR